jgi:hypothetical protein
MAPGRIPARAIGQPDAPITETSSATTVRVTRAGDSLTERVARSFGSSVAGMLLWNRAVLSAGSAVGSLAGRGTVR